MRTRGLISALALSALIVPAVSAQSSRGVIRGNVLVRGNTDAQPVLVSQQQDVCGESVANRHLVINKGRLANALVVLDYKGPADMKASPVTLRTDNCDFAPTVQVVPPGSTLILDNDDPITHTVNLVHRGRKLTTVELGIDEQEKQRGRLAEPKLLDVQCEYHDWMYAKVWVLDHPYYALTAKDGSFEIPLVPEGTYTLKVWHEELGMQAQEIIVQGGKSVTASFTYNR
jgi:hypothetical protein